MDWSEWPLLKTEDIRRIVYFAREAAVGHQLTWAIAALIWLLTAGAIILAALLGWAPDLVIAIAVLGSAAALGYLGYAIGTSLYVRLHILCDLVIPLAEVHDERVREAIEEAVDRLEDADRRFPRSR